MTKLAAVTLALCLPAVSFADIFFCQSENGSLLVRPSNPVLESELKENSDLNFVVDTEKGFTTTMTTSRIYSGECRTRENIIACAALSPDAPSILQINLLDNSFAHASLMGGGLVNSVTGTCTKA